MIDLESNEIATKEIAHEEFTKFIRQIETLCDEIMDADPNVEWSSKVWRDLLNYIQYYKNM